MFANKIVNTGRQYALDYAKGLAIMFMLVCHTVMYFSSGYKDDVLYHIGDSILGGPSTAPFFMVCLGVGICYSQRTSPRYLFRRGLFLLLGAYLLNLLRAGLFLVVLGFIYGWTDNELDMNLSDSSYFSNFIVDILQFAGVFFMFFALALKLRLSKWTLVFLAFAFQIFSHSFEQYHADNRYVTAFLALFLPVGDIDADSCISCFPFTVWAIYPIVGYLFGHLLQRVNDLDRFYNIIFWPTLVLSFFYFGLMITMQTMLPFSNLYYWHKLPEVFFYLCIDFCILSAFHLYARYLPQILFRPLTPFSKDITRIYCCSWCLICWTYMPIVLLYDERGIEPPYAYLCSIVVILASYYFQKWAKRERQDFH